MKDFFSNLRHAKSLDFFGFCYLQKWIIIGVLIGIVAGLGSVAFFLMLQVSTLFFLGFGAGYVPPNFEVISTSYTTVAERPWMIPLITGGGGLIVGLLTSRFAPESAGHGTEAVIDAFHNKKGTIRSRIPLLKTITASITIGSGGSGGREGPAAQIAAGFGSILGRLFKLRTEDRRIAVAAGLGAGVGSMFKAPLGAAILSTEIFYRWDFEVKALLPALIASVTGFVIFGSVFGWSPIFQISESAPEFNQPLHFLLYAVLGVCCAGTGKLYVFTFYKIQHIFQKWSIPNFIKPAIGGLLVGIIGMFLPQILGGGYGWLQIGVFDDIRLFPIWILLAILFLKILATSLTVGSGGSAGVFGPSLIIGGFVGAVVGEVFHSLSLFTDLQVSAIAIVGMVAFFGAVSKAPISTIIMGSEMTGSYVLLPAMILASVISYGLIGLKTTIYQSQVKDRNESPAHMHEYRALLKKLSVRDAVNPDFSKIHHDRTAYEASDILKNSKSAGIVIVDADSRYIGFIDSDSLTKLDRHDASLSEIISAAGAVPTVGIEASLYDAIKKISDLETMELPVTDKKNIVLGTVSVSNIMNAYDRGVDDLEDEQD